MDTYTCHQCGQSFPADKRSSCDCFTPVKKEAERPSDATACSPSSALGAEYITDVCTTLRCERDAAVEALRGVESLISITDTRGWISHDQRLALLENIRSAIPENVQVEAPNL